MSNIDQLKSTISSKRGVARGNIYKVTLPSINNISSREINLLCRAVNVPGRQIMTVERRIGNTFQKVAYGHAFDDVNLSFLLLNDYGVRRYFENWQSLCLDPNTLEPGYLRGQGGYGQTVQIAQLKKGVGFPLANIDLGFKIPSEIQGRLPSLGPINLAQGEIDLDFISGGDIIYECELQEAFPTTMSAIELGDDQQDSILQLNIQLSYRDWRNTGKQEGSALGDFVTSQVGGFLGRII
jgi:hypothetical protein